MRECVVFNGLNSLDHSDIRNQVVRIPEVIRKLQQAQRVWDQQGGVSFDFVNFISSDDRIYLNNIKLKSLAAAVVQLGLYDRYRHRHGVPDFFVGNTVSDAPVNVAIGQCELSDLVAQSAAIRGLQPKSYIHLANGLELSGMGLSHYRAYRRVDDNESSVFYELEDGGRDINKIVLKIVDELEVRRFVNIGPGHQLIHPRQPEFELLDIQILESIDLDPMLSWFWSPAIQAAFQGSP